MYMKIIPFRLTLTLGLMALLSSCLFIPKTYTMIFDEKNPVEQNVIVSFISNTSDGYFYVKAYNGISILEGIYGGKGWSSNDKVKLTIPAGETSFTLDVRYTISNQYSSYTYKADDVILKYNLEAGKQYMFKGSRKLVSFLKGYNFFVGIYDVTEKPILLHEWQLGESK